MKNPHFSPILAAAPFFYVSGILALQESGTAIPGGIETQTEAVLARLQQILHTEGLQKRDVAKTTVWIRNATDFWKFDAIYSEFFGAHRPARSTVVSELVIESAVIEIEAVALRS
jgi:2-iminobutanoate/2-iminopropanoate deaminase